MMKLSVLICIGLSSHAVAYTPRMFRPGGKFYVPPPAGPGAIDPKTRAELSGILNGILQNLQHHSAALPQIAQDIVTQYKLSDKDADVVEGIRKMYANLNADVSDEMAFTSAPKDVQGKAKTVLAAVLQKVDSSHTPRMFAPGGKYYNPPHFGHSAISKQTRDEVGNILKGILSNMMKHKAALTQAKELVKQYPLNADVTEGLMNVYDDLQAPSPGDGLKQLLKDEKALSSEADRSQASTVLALVIQQANASYVPGQYRPRRYSGYIPSRTRGLGISKGTRDQVAGILQGILKNLTSHKAALGQVADDVTKKVLNGDAEVTEALQGAYANMANQKELAGATKEVQGQVKTVLASVLAKVVKH